MKINFEELFDEKILKRGYNYYLENSVHEVNKKGSCYEGLVYGTEIYEVEIGRKGFIEYNETYKFSDRRISKDSRRKIKIYRKEKLRRYKKDITTYENIARWSKTCRKDSRRI